MKTTEIVSPHNARVKEWAKLLTKKGRDAQRKWLLEGVRLVEEALLSGADVETVLYLAGKGIPAAVERLLPEKTERIAVSPAVMAKCADTETPQGVIAVVRKPAATAADLLAAEAPLVVALDGVQDPGNVGTIIRSADAAGATGVILGRGTADLYNPKTVRATMGSLFHLPVVEGDLSELLPLARDRGIRIAGASLDATTSCYDADLTGPLWLVAGNEGSGISAELSPFLTDTVIIPMRGRAESLNVAMATTVLLFEAQRQRYFKP